jgi:hypothetical protein
MLNQTSKVCLGLAAAILIPTCLQAKEVAALGKMGMGGPLHATHVTTYGKTVETRVSVGIGNGDANACNIVYQVTESVDFDEGDTYLMRGDFLTGMFGEGFSCVTETYRVPKQKPVSVTYKIYAESSPIYDYNKADPANQLIDLPS